MIRVSKLNKYYNRGKSNEVHVIDNTTLEFGDTGLVCILGESGSGKTTLLNILGGLDTYQSGQITIDDKTLHKSCTGEMEQLRNQKFGYVFQDQFLLQEDTVAYNLRLALNTYDISEEEKEERIDYVLSAVDMKKFKKRMVSQLSGGQRQRVAIARALVRTPDIIFADEPTGNLDEANTMRIMGIIKKISKDCLVILVTHEKRIAEFFADRIIHISDGRVVKDVRQEGKEAYRYSDDTNIYLGEYEKESYQNNKISINLYSSGESREIRLNMVYTGGRLYIQTPDETEVAYLTSTDEMQMVEGARPELKPEEAWDFEYSLKPVKKSKRPGLSLSELWKLANVNVRMLGKRQIFLIISLLVTSVLLVLAVADYMTAAAIDKKSIVTEDSHYLEVMGKRNSSASNNQYYESFNKIYDSFIKSGMAEDIYISLDTSLSFTYDGYGQTRQLSYSFSDFSFVTLEHLDERDIVCGRMPEKRDEIVVDRWLIDEFLENGSIFRTLMPDLSSFLNLWVKSEVSGQKLKIVGICDVKEPTVFIDKYAGISTASWADKVASLKQLQSEYPGQFDAVSLASGEVLVSEEVYAEDADSTGEFKTKNESTFKVAGTFPDEFGVDYVVDDSSYKDILGMYICSSRRFMIYTDTEAKTDLINFFDQNLGGYDTSYVKFVATDNYTRQMNKFLADRSVTINTRLIVTITIFAISLLMLYFTMKANVMKITQELSVYRLVGIPKKSIIFSFILEIIIITSYTVLPVVLAVSGIIKFIAAAPSLQTGIVYPWYAMGLLLLFLYGVNILVGIVPIYNTIKRPPAQIIEKLA
jgi:ABC-type lipoprotein export system ATPase subunit